MTIYWLNSSQPYSVCLVLGFSDVVNIRGLIESLLLFLLLYLREERALLHFGSLEGHVVEEETAGGGIVKHELPFGRVVGALGEEQVPATEGEGVVKASPPGQGRDGVVVDHLEVGA